MSEPGTLTVSGGGSLQLVLSGNVTAIQNGAVGKVDTGVERCSNNETPGVCVLGKLQFTSTNLASPINVSKGQQIQVTVTISFS